MGRGDGGSLFAAKRLLHHRTRLEVWSSIAIDGDVVVFVEVKTRRDRVFGEPEEAIDYMKLRSLRASMNHYVKCKNVYNSVRLDVVTVVGTPEGGMPEINLIEDFPIY